MQTLGELKASGYPDRSVKDELRANLLERMKLGGPLFEGIVGFEDSVVPTLERAVLAGHDIILLGERGQAKSRLIRHLASLLDEQVPAVAGCEINDHPYHPICGRCRALEAEHGDELPITWIGRELRYAEKLATPDASVSDLLGDVDPIRVAEGRYLGDELTIHYGLVPRTHRGIFAINELPDLPERIQVSLLNILEERDIQIRGYKIRLPLDLMLVASANPEDYTHRGRIISPLKDRFGTQVRTHYPRTISEEIAIMRQESAPSPAGVSVTVPVHIEEVIAAFTHHLRASSQVNQRSGVSVRFSIGARETVAASALRRAARANDPEAVARAVDLWTILPASIGRVEFDALEEGREPQILERALKRALLDVFRARLSGEDFSGVLERFDSGLELETSDLTNPAELLAQTGGGRGLKLDRLARRVGLSSESPAAAAGALEFCLEGLHLTKRLNKSATEPGGWRFESA